jgi:hypothetical protein
VSDERYTIEVRHSGGQTTSVWCWYVYRCVDGDGHRGAVRELVADGHCEDEPTARGCAELVKARLEGRDVLGELHGAEAAAASLKLLDAACDAARAELEVACKVGNDMGHEVERLTTEVDRLTTDLQVTGSELDDARTELERWQRAARLAKEGGSAARKDYAVAADEVERVRGGIEKIIAVLREGAAEYSHDLSAATVAEGAADRLRALLGGDDER